MNVVTPLSEIPGLLCVAGLPLRGLANLQVDGHLIRYSVERFDLSAFEVAGVVRRQDVLRSVPKRQSEFLFGRLAARLALQKLGSETLEVPSGDYRQPIWPSGIVGSITHSAGYAAALVLRRGPVSAVGIDIERVPEEAVHQALLSSVIDSEELRTLKSLTDGELALPTLATLAFSAKEAFFKASFGMVGRYFDFSAVRVLSVDLATSTMELCVNEPLGEEFAPGTVHLVTFGFLDAHTLYTACIW